ncbi:aminotransferase class I/II-fold pyridoxal phosphate-dependent enzyme [Candidatus Solirubrobacter pratensis]|uniref:aminotransferase class I/II-fold pyridoxal phosphate-dependent enzyme n=1 Tax=Candidatus Solirubrobacter pratensis TaxID=1298857 RepID=UPI00041EDF93|nr:aminotransferase class I/II-fold pyridoxal phosphate-dependent enzyme [Candidatus Solirubrobacter pratensis]
MSAQYQLNGRSASEIAASVERGVASGALAPGDPLPSVRALASSLAVSPTTVAAALSELRRRGIVVSRPRSGTRIGERPAVRARSAPVAPAGARDLASGNPDPAFLPDLAAVLKDLPAPHRLYGDAPVLEELAAVAGGRLCVVNGALDGIERVLAAHLQPGDAVAVEDPGWPGVIDLVRALGLQVAGVRTDERGMVPDGLDRALRGGARAVVLTPRGQNPAGSAHDAARAAGLRAVLTPDVLLVEDDHLGPVAGVAWLSAAGSTARHAVVRSVSKWLGPDLRCAILTGDELTLARVEGRQSLGPGWVSGLIQRLTARLWSDPDVLALVARAREAYVERREAMLAALSAHGLEASGASGLNVWVPVPDEDAAVRALLATGVSIAAGGPFRLATPPAVRITTATVKPAEAPPLAAALAAAVRPPRRTRAA